MNEMTPKEISKFLELAGSEGSRPFDRLEKGKPVSKAKETVEKSGLKPLAQAALYLYFDCFEEAHNIANDHEGSTEGNWIHAIVHRREPDAGNSRYWYARVNVPAKISGEIAREALAILKEQPVKELEPLVQKLEKSKRWEPEAFVGLCDQFRKKDPSVPGYGVLAKIQESEWRGLIAHILST